MEEHKEDETGEKTPLLVKKETPPVTKTVAPQFEYYGETPPEPIKEKSASREDNSNNKDATNNTSSSTTNKKKLTPGAAEELTKLKGTQLFRQQCHFNLAKHNLASQHLKTLNFWMFTLPAAIIAMASGILAFLATSGLFEDRTDQILNVIVGCLSFFVVFLQNISAQRNYESRSQMHESTAIDLRDLREDLENVVNQSRVMMRYRVTVPDKNKAKDLDNDKNSNENGDSPQQGKGISDIESKGEKNGETSDQTHEEPPHNSVEVLFDGIQKRYNQCLKGCKSTVPLPINDAFEQLDSRLNATMTIIGHRELKRIYGPDYNNVIYFQACNDLGLRFSTGLFWPFMLPDAEKAVDITMKNLQVDISTRGKDFWNVLIENTSQEVDAANRANHSLTLNLEDYITKRQATFMVLVAIVVVALLVIPLTITTIKWARSPASA